MYWQEDEDKGEKYQVPEDVLDLLFKIECKSLPLDHGLPYLNKSLSSYRGLKTKPGPVYIRYMWQNRLMDGCALITPKQKC